jgi:HEAT repeat protein
MLSDTDGRVADAAVLSLAGLESVAVPLLIAVISNAGQSDVVKFRAATALSKAGTSAAQSLKQVAASGGPSSVWAVFALGQAGDSSARDVIRKLALSADPETRFAAEKALQRL